MNANSLLSLLLQASTLVEAQKALDAFMEASEADVSWHPVGGRQNNRGIIEVSGDPGRAVIERVTNAIDAILEFEHGAHSGTPECRSPREAAVAWLNIPQSGLAGMTQAARRAVAQRVSVRLLPGDHKSSRTIEIRDYGIGLRPEQMPTTILSLNESNKMQKHYLAGAYGQGGSSTFASSALTLIASRRGDSDSVGFTVVRFRDLPADEYKTGHYVYLLSGNALPTATASPSDFESGTLVKHFGYDLSSYPSPLGPASLYGLLNKALFDPVLPVWFDSRLHDYRRVIKGARNALNGAVDEGDDDARGPRLSHRMPMLFVPLGEHGRIGIEYWVLAPADKGNKRPIAAYVDPARPIVLSLNGQSQEELSSLLVRKDAELPYLLPRLICHVDCNSLTPLSLRSLFVSNREGARRGTLLEDIKAELVRALQSDDDLRRLNQEARDASVRDRDEGALADARKAVARILRLQGYNVSENVGAARSAVPDSPDRPSRPRKPRVAPAALELRDPPTYVRIVWDESRDLTFFPEQRRYIRIETDAEGSYHNANDPAASRVNVIVSNGEVTVRGSTPLQGGRMRALFDCPAGARVGGTGKIRIELSRPGLPVLFDERDFVVVAAPPAKNDGTAMSLPQFDYRPVSPDDEMWTTLNWPENVEEVASSSVSDEGTHVLYYSTAFPRFRAQKAAFERKDVALAASFETRYAIWLVVHSLLYEKAIAQRSEAGISETEADLSERQERVRAATLACMFAARESQSPDAKDGDD